MSDLQELMNSDEYKEIAEAEEKFFAEHWANDLLDAPHALISVIETKISRALLSREREIIELLENHLPIAAELSPITEELLDKCIRLIKGETE